MAMYNLESNNTAPLVLLVEDDAIVQKVNRILLERAGCQVNTVDTGKQAVAKITTQYDLIFMDIGLPDISGYEVTTQIREKLGDKLTPIIVLTAFDIRDVEEKCLAAGANEVFSKTLPPDDFRKLLNRYLKQPAILEGENHDDCYTNHVT